MIVDNHGLEHLWTLFQWAPIDIRIAAGRTIQNCLVSIKVCSIEHPATKERISFSKNHGELIRSFDGIFYVILNTLSTEHPSLLAITLDLIAEIVRDGDNLQILTDLGVVSRLSQLNDLVRLERSRRMELTFVS